MKELLETSEVIEKHAEMISCNQARIIDGYVRLYVKKKPLWLPTQLYLYFLSKVLVLAYFRRTTSNQP